MRVVLTGPESSGKTALTVFLAERFRVPFAPEYARAFLEAHGPDYTYELLLDMSRAHVAFQRERVPAHAPLGLLDTDLLNYKVWCEVVFGRCHGPILRAIERESDHVYLLCAPDLPWEPDPLRENPHDRGRLFERHLREIERLGRPYRTVRGRGPARFAAAEAAFRELCAGGAGGPDRGPPPERGRRAAARRPRAAARPAEKALPRVAAGSAFR